MRILHLDGFKGMRGGQWQVLRLIEGLTAQGAESTLLAPQGSPLFEAARKRGWRVEPLRLVRAARLARGHDLLHAHDSHGHTVGAIVRPSRLVVSRRVAFPIGFRMKYSRVRHYLAVSEFVKSVLVAGGVPAGKISVVHDGVPLLQPASGSAVVALDNAGDSLKGTALAAEAARLAEAPLQLSTNLETDLRGAAVFVYITHSEGLGSGALLAMSAGVAVVASKVGGLPEIVRHRENGLLVDNSAPAIAAAIRELRENPDLARRLGDAARLTIIERFSVDRMVRRTMEVYRQVVG